MRAASFVVTAVGLAASVFALSACGGGAGKAQDLATSSDLAGDASPAVDLSGDLAMSTIGIACGSTPCTAAAQFCCTGDNGLTGSCGNGVASSCGASVIYCDGPEDCPPAEPHCCALNGTAQCGGSACGGTQDTGYALCHTANDCGAPGVPCCPSPNNGRYALCVPAGC
jgi:hypothetical protein